MQYLCTLHTVLPVSQNPEFPLYSKQCEFIGSLFGFTCNWSIQTKTGIWNVGGGRKSLVINVVITGKMEYNENEIPSHKGCRHLLKKTFFLVQNHTVVEVGGDLYRLSSPIALLKTGHITYVLQNTHLFSICSWESRQGTVLFICGAFGHPRAICDLSCLGTGS